MYKPAALRAFLVAAIPELARDPDRLSIYIPQGSIVATMAPGLSFEYRYTLNVILTDFAGDPDAVMAPLVDWMRTNQPDDMANADLAQRAIGFEADIISDAAVDLAISLSLTERAISKPRDGGGYVVTHPAEPQPEGMAEAVHWQLYARNETTDDETLLAEWDSPEA